MSTHGDGETTGPAAAWEGLVDALRVAGERLAAGTTELSEDEQADAFRALVRALNNQLGRFEIDRERPELVAFNEWREKLLMDNPDFRYWLADIRPDRGYRIVGNIGDSVFQSITVYTAAGLIDAAATSRIDSDSLVVAPDGSFDVVLSPRRPDRLDDVNQVWLALPEGATVVWVRQFHESIATDRLGWCRIEPLDEPEPPPIIEPDRFAHRLGKVGSTMSMLPRILAASTAADLAAPNSVRYWEEMSGGAAFTEPGIRYVRGAWQLADGEALVVEGPLVACRYWNILLYSRFLNSLDARHRTVSRTAASSRIVDGRYRFVLSAVDPGPDVGDWLDTEGRPFGLFVMRFLLPESEPELPTVRVVALADL